MKRRYYIDYLKAFGCITIVALHIIGEGYIRTTEQSYYYYLRCIQELTRWAVPVFVMVSGCNLLGRENEYMVAQKHIRKMLVTVFTWGVIYIFADPLVDLVMRNPVYFSMDLFHKLFQGQAYHMWFCFMIIGMYMLIPILNPIVLEKCRCEYLILISLFGEVVLSVAAALENTFPVVSTISGHFRFPRVGFYMLYFIMGYYLDRYANFSKRTRFLGYILAIAMMIAIVGNEYLDAVHDSPIVIVSVLYDFFLFVFSSAVFLFFKTDFKIGGSYSIIRKISDESFAIYIMHAYVYIRLSYKGIHGAVCNPIVAVPVVTALICAVCYLASRVIRKIPLIGKWIL